MTEGQNETASRSETRPSSPTSATISVDLPIKCGHLFGPFFDPLQWIAFKYTESASLNIPEPANLDRTCLELFKNVELARSPSEQNLEIVLKNGQFYFRALHDIEGASRRLFAWFSQELSSKLPTPLSSTLNGSKRYFCGLCNQVFLNPNPVVVHILFSCPKRHDILPPMAKPPQSPQPQPQPPPQSQSQHQPHQPQSLPLSQAQSQAPPVPVSAPIGPKKRGFDIASLVDSDDSSSAHENKKSTRKQFELDSALSNSIPTSHSMTSAFRTPMTPNRPIRGQSQLMPPMSSALLSSLTSPLSILPSPNSFSSGSSPFPSAFKKVDKSSSLGLSSSTNPNAYDLATLYATHRGLAQSAAGLFPTQPSVSHSLLSPPAPTLASAMSQQSQGAPHSGSTGSSNGSNKLIPNSLLPFLPPSLAALSFPQTNWCAKCNATFRMTSDLVYHMRSHHKRDIIADPIKKKREEKLRCNICGETFRERHHLTRHMTSHQ